MDNSKQLEELQLKLIESMKEAIEEDPNKALLAVDEVELLTMIFEEYMHMKCDWLAETQGETAAKKYQEIFDPFFYKIIAKITAQGYIRDPAAFIAKTLERQTMQ